MESRKLEHFTHRFASWVGTAGGFAGAVISIFIWLIIGAIYHFSYGWENVLTVYIGIITFLMIFIMQRSQRKELTAVHAKLNELIVATRNANNSLINAEELTERELQELQKTHRQIAMGKAS